MAVTVVDIAALKSGSRRLRIVWVCAVVAVPLLLVPAVWRLARIAGPLPTSEVLLALTTVLTCGFLSWFVVYLPRTAGRASRRDTLQ